MGKGQEDLSKQVMPIIRLTCVHKKKVFDLLLEGQGLGNGLADQVLARCLWCCRFWL